MTVENLHDAIGQLPSDLIAKVDEKRCRKPKVFPFKRYAAMAASLALVICGGYLFLRMRLLNMVVGGSTETAAEAPAAVMQAPEEANGFGITGIPPSKRMPLMKTLPAMILSLRPMPPKISHRRG